MTDTVTTQVCLPDNGHAMGIDAAQSVSATLKALADPLRLRMLSAIAADPRGETCVCDLLNLADVTQPTVSHHLKVLKDVSLVTSERRGTWAWYRILPERRAAITALLEALAPATVAEAATVPTEDVSSEAASDLSAMDTWVTNLAEDIAQDMSHLSKEIVLTIVRESYVALARTAKINRHLIPLTERFARQRLADMTRDRTNGVPQVLFVCVANAGRSQLAAALVNQLAGDKVVARSAGSAPAEQIHPHVRQVLSTIEGDAVAERFPKPLTDDAVRAADVVITMGCGDVCPILPGVRYEDWAVGDPALASPQGVEAIRQDITERVHTLLASLV